YPPFRGLGFVAPVGDYRRRTSAKAQFRQSAGGEDTKSQNFTLTSLEPNGIPHAHDFAQLEGWRQLRDRLSRQASFLLRYGTNPNACLILFRRSVSSASSVAWRSILHRPCTVGLLVGHEEAPARIDQGFPTIGGKCR